MLGNGLYSHGIKQVFMKNKYSDCLNYFLVMKELINGRNTQLHGTGKAWLWSDTDHG